jgi:hypothetical protein
VGGVHPIRYVSSGLTIAEYNGTSERFDRFVFDFFASSFLRTERFFGFSKNKDKVIRFLHKSENTGFWVLEYL